VTLKRSLKVIQSGIVLCEQPTRELFAIAKFLFSIVTVALSSVVSHAHSQTLVKNLEIYIPNMYSTLPRQWPRFRKDVYYWDNWAILCGKSMMMMLSRFDTDQSVVDGRTDGHICTFSRSSRGSTAVPRRTKTLQTDCTTHSACNNWRCRRSQA